MNNEFEELQNKWNNAKGSRAKSITSDEILSRISNNSTDNIHFYYGTLIILLVTLMVISAFFYYIAPVKELLSRVGAGLMISSLLIRISIEISSLIKAKRIDILENTLKMTNKTIVFYKFRKLIHESITLPIVTAYTIGFYMITPEFSRYLDLWKMLLIDSSYIVIAVILVIHIRKGIKKEMQALLGIIELRKEIIE